MIDKKVEHVTYGLGTITQADGNHITVSFDGSGEIKRFLYPESFGKFMKFSDEKLQEEANKEIQKINTKKLEDYNMKRIKGRQIELRQRRDRLLKAKKR